MPQLDVSEPVKEAVHSIRDDGDHKSVDSALRQVLREYDEDLKL